jgi:hypothetical protein
MLKPLLLGSVLHLVALASVASAHYLWFAVEKQPEGEAANIYFEEGPAAGDGHYLDPIAASAKVWLRTVDSPKPALLKASESTAPNKRWLTAAVAKPAPRSVDCYAKFGVYRYGQTDVLLHYYARHLDVSTHEDLHELSRAEQLDLDIVPHDHADEVELTVLWKGKPAADRQVLIRGPQKFQQNLKTDAKGRVEFKPPAAGKYLFRTNVEEATPGKEGDKEYSLIRHHATMLLTLPLQK